MLKKSVCAVSISITIAAHYQDIIINNTVIDSGSRECASRYEPIKDLIQQYKRPITVLDIGASEGYFSFRIAHDFNASCVMIEGNYPTNPTEKIADKLEELCKKNTDLKNIIFLKTCITPQQLKILGECEHFDVVLALNVIHHFGSQWKQVTDAILDLGSHIIIETPPAEDKQSAGQENLELIQKYLETKGGKIIGRFKRQTQSDVLDNMYLFSLSKKHLKRKHWNNSLPKSEWENYVITSTFKEKTFYKKHTNQIKTWYPGINLLTFKILHGAYPEKDIIFQELQKFKFDPHNDLKIWNIIIQGHNMVSIDGDDPKWNLPHYNQDSDFQALLMWFRPLHHLVQWPDFES